MRAMRGVGVVAACVAAVGVLSGCGTDDGTDAKPKAKASASASETADQPYFPAPEPEEYPDNPEGRLDKLADEKGWIVDDFYASASAFAKDMCDSLPVSAVDGMSRPQWLAEGGHLEGAGGDILLAGVPEMCPEWLPAVKQAVSGKYERWFGSGTFVVRSKKPEPAVEGEEPEQTIPPGTYRAQGKMEDCYWERTSESGDIIDNNFATSARSITVTIRASDGQFTSERCEVWKPVK